MSLNPLFYYYLDLCLKEGGFMRKGIPYRLMPISYYF